MSLQGLLMTIVSAFLTIFANLILRHAVNTSEFTFSVFHFLKLFLMPVFILGIVLYFAAMVVWFKVLATEVLSSCYPILVGITFFGVTLGAVFFYKEPVSLIKATGILAIILGIILVARS
jgi:multidrug transporter EmrE-like cation transporter